MIKQKFKKNQNVQRKLPITSMPCELDKPGMKSKISSSAQIEDSIGTVIAKEEVTKANTYYLHETDLTKEEHGGKRLSTSMTIRTTKQRVYSPWKGEGEYQKASIKWIGVNHTHGNEKEITRFAFPKRKQRSCEQSLSNFLLKYGGSFKKYQRQKAEKESMMKKPDTPHSVVTNAATYKLKPRLYWFERRRTSNSENARIHDRFISANFLAKQNK